MPLDTTGSHTYLASYTYDDRYRFSLVLEKYEPEPGSLFYQLLLERHYGESDRSQVLSRYGSSQFNDANKAFQAMNAAFVLLGSTIVASRSLRP
jgi:hypothetical protein